MPNKDEFNFSYPKLNYLLYFLKNIYKIPEIPE